MKVDLVDHMGSDLTVVNAARVSFDKQSSYSFDPYNEVYLLKHEDERLIQYLAKHGHWTPFGHCAATVRIKAPIFVARQLGKHQVGLVWNEVSRRYVDSAPEFYEPPVWRKRAENVKQGSSSEGVFELRWANYVAHLEDALELYNHALEIGICPEQARMILPQSMYTEWYWTGSLAAFARVCKLRLDPHSQRETREVAEGIAGHIERLFPVSWKALMEAKDGE
jgi:thymidylate synthase (FAD)